MKDCPPPHEEIAGFLEQHEEMWAMTCALDRTLGFGDVPIEADTRSYYAHLAIMWGAADSFSQARALSVETLALGITHHLRQYDNWEENFRDIMRVQRDPLFEPLIRAAGAAIHQLLSGQKRPEAAYLPLHETYLAFCRRAARSCD